MLDSQHNLPDPYDMPATPLDSVDTKELEPVSATSRAREALETLWERIAPYSQQAMEALSPALRASFAGLKERLRSEVSATLGSVVAVSSVGVSLIVTLAAPSLQLHGIYLLFFAAIILSTVAGRLRAGLLAILLSTLGCALLLRPPFTRQEVPVLSHLSLAVFALVALATAILTDSLYAAGKNAETARSQAEARGRRARFLAEASGLLAGSLDYETTLDRVARMALPQFADGCTVDLIEDGAAMHRIVEAHVDPQQEARLREMHRRYPPDPQGEHPLARVLQTGKPVLVPEVTAEMLAIPAGDADYLQMIRDLAPRSLICVPLIARGRTLGAITFLSATPGRRYTPTDLMIAQELALRAALAVDQARLYRAAQEEIAARRRMEAALRASEAQVRVLNARLQRAMTETHHRVKNNLQLIASMVDMRLMEEMDAYPVEDLQRLSQCVGSLAVVHDLLTHGIKEEGQTDFVSAKGILERLLPLMQQTAGNSRLEFRIEDARLPAKQGTSLALVANELISNAIKHGRGEVRTTFCVAGDTAVLEVCDDGPGFPEGFDSRRAANTGLELVESLTRTDLCGRVSYGSRPEGGGRVAVTIPLSMTG